MQERYVCMDRVEVRAGEIGVFLPVGDIWGRGSAVQLTRRMMELRWELEDTLGMILYASANMVKVLQCR